MNSWKVIEVDLILRTFSWDQNAKCLTTFIIINFFFGSLEMVTSETHLSCHVNVYGVVEATNN